MSSAGNAPFFHIPETVEWLFSLWAFDWQDFCHFSDFHQPFKTRHRWHQLLKLLLLFNVQVELCKGDKRKRPRTLPLILFCYLSPLRKPDAIKRLKTLLICLFKNFNLYLPLDFFFINICSKQSFPLICKIVSVKETTLWNKENLCISVSYYSVTYIMVVGPRFLTCFMPSIFPGCVVYTSAWFNMLFCVSWALRMWNPFLTLSYGINWRWLIWKRNKCDYESCEATKLVVHITCLSSMAPSHYSHSLEKMVTWWKSLKDFLK